MDNPDTRVGPAGAASAREAEAMRITLRLLSAVEADARVTQRTLASELGIALGLVNSYLRRCMKHGLIKVRAVPRRRIAYYLTPQGFSEKSRLAGRFLYHSLDFFRRARASCESTLERAELSGMRTIALLGGGDLCEIMIVCSLGHKARVVCVVDETATAESIGGLAVRRDLASLVGRVDGVIVTAIVGAPDLYRQAVALLGSDRVLAPSILGIEPAGAGARRAEELR